MYMKGMLSQTQNSVTRATASSCDTLWCKGTLSGIKARDELSEQKVIDGSE